MNKFEKFSRQNKVATKKMIRDFKKSLKDSIFDETLTLYIFRPISFLFLRLMYKTSITPNQISFMSILAGIVGGAFFVVGTHFWFIMGGAMFAIATILDCLDGMIARLKNTGTYIGRIVDGVSDYITSIFIHVGFAMGIDNGQFNFPLNPWVFMVLASIFNIMHSIVVDYYKNEFMYYALGKGVSASEEKERFKQELKKMKNKKTKLLDKIVIAIYIGYSHLQTSTKDIQNKKYDKETYFQKNKTLIHLWFLIGPNMHIVILMIAAFLYMPMIYFYYTIGFGNLLMIVLWIIQIKVNRKIVETVKE